MSDQDPCEICSMEAVTIPSADFDGVHQRCPRCGEFMLAGTAGTLLRRGITQAIRAKVSGWVHDQNRDDTIPMITSNVLQQVSARTLPTVMERAERLLIEVLRGGRPDWVKHSTWMMPAWRQQPIHEISTNLNFS